MASKFKLDPAPTFKASVTIPVPGTNGKGDEVEFIFKHRTRDELIAFLDGSGKLKNVELVLAVASGWELDEPFDAEHIKKMDQGYTGSAKAVFDTYVNEISGNRLGN